MKSLKAQLIQIILEQLSTKLNRLKSDEESIKQSAAGETKSSAGDKHETSRELIHQEREIISKRLTEIENQIDHVRKIQSFDNKESIQDGAFVRTSIGDFFIGPALGFVLINDQKIACISIASPIGLMLKDKKPGDSFYFRGSQVIIQELK